MSNSNDHCHRHQHHIPTLIVKKRDGKSLTDDEISFLIDAIANRRIDDAQIGIDCWFIVVISWVYCECNDALIDDAHIDKLTVATKASSVERSLKLSNVDFG